MNISEDLNSYLSGEKFSNGLRVDLTQRGPVESRVSYLASIARNARVVHLGFADHPELVSAKMANGSWLHRRLIDEAKVCIGIDIDSNAVSKIREISNISEIYQHNVMEDEPLPRITEHEWDFFIIGEVLEHIDNPVLFLSSIRRKYGANVGRFVITVPNAWDIDSFRFLLNGQECINSDHRFWFTPYTLAKVCASAGYRVEGLHFVHAYAPGRIKSFFLRRFPQFQSGIVITLII